MVVAIAYALTDMPAPCCTYKSSNERFWDSLAAAVCGRSYWNTVPAFI